jgi:ribonuclease III
MFESDLNSLETTLKYHFHDPLILKTALTHRSSLNENRGQESNERLEFLGDAVLELVISSFLFKTKSKEPEGILTAARSAIVRTESLAVIAEKLNLGKFLIMSKGEEASGGRANQSLLANTVEAVIGAVYLDSNFETAKIFVETHLLDHALSILENQPLKDNKSRLQEIIQRQGFSSPTYQEISSTGPDHEKTFTVSVGVNNKQIATGTGRTKQEAEQNAAAKAISLV